MKVVRSHKREGGGGEPFVFSIGRDEKAALLAILAMYPVLDVSYHRLSQKSKTTGAAEQEWLEEAMSQQQREHKKKLSQVFQSEQQFFREGKHAFRFTLTGEQLEWMLCVLNNIRVGSWVRLGRPEMEAARHSAVQTGKTQFVAAMELSGYFQSVLLEATSDS